jgi:hypothetical protein
MQESLMLQHLVPVVTTGLYMVTYFPSIESDDIWLLLLQPFQLLSVQNLRHRRTQNSLRVSSSLV